MEIKLHRTGKEKIAEILSDNIVLKDIDDTVNLIAECGALDAGKIIIYEAQVSPEFFDLKTRLAGEILQKFSNYRSQLAIIGDFSRYKSKALEDFIRECNRGNRVFFTVNLNEALEKLSLRQ